MPAIADPSPSSKTGFIYVEAQRMMVAVSGRGVEVKEVGGEATLLSLFQYNTVRFENSLNR
jgi:hypothetical protein